jgi:hypothetical protein
MSKVVHDNCKGRQAGSCFTFMSPLPHIQYAEMVPTDFETMATHDNRSNMSSKPRARAERDGLLVTSCQSHIVQDLPEATMAGLRVESLSGLRRASVELRKRNSILPKMFAGIETWVGLDAKMSCQVCEVASAHRHCLNPRFESSIATQPSKRFD